MTDLTSTPSGSLNSLAGTWVIDANHSRIGFSAKHAMVTSVHGTFNEFSGTVNVSEDGVADVSVVIQAASIDTRHPKRNGHLNSPDFLNTEAYPTVTFTATGVRGGTDGDFTLTGRLTILDVTREISLDVEPSGVQVDQFGNTRAGFEATTAISRKDFNLVWNVALETGGVLVSDKIKIALDVSALKQD